MALCSLPQPPERGEEACEADKHTCTVLYSCSLLQVSAFALSVAPMPDQLHRNHSRSYATALYALCLHTQSHKDVQSDLYEAHAGEQPFFPESGRNAHTDRLLLGATCPCWNATVHSRASSKLLPLFQEYDTGHQTRISGSGQKANGRAGFGSTLQRQPGSSPPDVSMRPLSCACGSLLEDGRLSEIGIPHSLRSFSKHGTKGTCRQCEFCSAACMRLLVSLVRHKGPMTCRRRRNQGGKQKGLQITLYGVHTSAIGPFHSRLRPTVAFLPSARKAEESRHGSTLDTYWSTIQRPEPIR